MSRRMRHRTFASPPDRLPLAAATVAIFICLTAPASGGATFYSSFDQWSSAASPFDTLDFQLGSLQFLSEQYAPFGVHFDGVSALGGPAPAFFPLDGWGIASASVPNPVIPVALDGGRFGFGVEYIFGVRIQLFNGAALLWDSGDIVASPLVDSAFAGVVTDSPFDQIKISSAFFTTLEADNFYVGHAVPAPGALAGFLVFGACPRRRRH